VEDFWVFYSHLKRPCDVVFDTFFQYQLFRSGIQPLWDDAENLDGGKWMVKCKKEFSSRLWEDLVLAFVGDMFGLGDEITGVVISMREEMPYDILNVWNKNASSQESRHAVRDAFVRVLKLQPGTILEYKIHNERKGNSTQFKNTEVFKV
jgi:translation initiation factor 4E